MNGSDLREIEGLLSDFAWYADRGDGEGLAALFLPDAALVVSGEEHRGRERIADDCRRRASDPSRKVRHVWSNLRVEGEDGGEVRTAAIQLTFEQSGGQPGTQLRINDLSDRFAKGPDGQWRLAHRLIARPMAL